MSSYSTNINDNETRDRIEDFEGKSFDSYIHFIKNNPSQELERCDFLMLALNQMTSPAKEKNNEQ